MLNSVEKVLNMLIFSSNCLIAVNNILVQKLRTKQIGNIYFNSLCSPIIKRPIHFHIKKISKSSYSFKAALPLEWDYDNFVTSPSKLYVQNIISQIIMLISKIREIAYRSTEKETSISNATIKFKLGNPVNIHRYMIFLSPVIGLYLNKVSFNLLKDGNAGEKIETKISWKRQANQNSRTYRSEEIL